MGLIRNTFHSIFKRLMKINVLGVILMYFDLFYPIFLDFSVFHPHFHAIFMYFHSNVAPAGDFNIFIWRSQAELAQHENRYLRSKSIFA